MKLEIDIPEEKVQYFSQDAKTELKEQSIRIALEIADEASRIEEGRRLPTAHSEITQSIVKEAAAQPRMTVSRKKNYKIKIIQAIAFISTLISGNLLDTSKFTETNHVIWFIVVLFVAIATTIYSIFNQENNG